MSEDHTSLLRFSLEESVWFQKGQEVEELYSISLEPNVSAHQVEQYVILKGTLDLMGEYKPTEGTEQEEGTENPFQRYVSVIEQREHHLFEFHQQFPVDITIPAERVREMDELNVGVHTFDYKMPEKDYLQITADLWIGGVYENLPDEQDLVVEEEDREETSHYQIDSSSRYQEDHHLDHWNEDKEEEKESAEEITIQADANRENEDEQTEIPLYRLNDEEEDQESDDVADSTEVHLNTNIPFLENNHNQEDHFYVETKVSPQDYQQRTDDESEETKKEDSPFAFEPDQLFNRMNREDYNQTFSIPDDGRYDEEPPKLMGFSPPPAEFEKEDSPIDDRLQIEQSQIDAGSAVKETVEEAEMIVPHTTREPKEERVSNQYVKKQYHSSESKRDSGNEEQAEGKTKSLLYDLFTEQEEAQQAKVRVCIVQNGENIDVIADRYKTSVQHIARINGLEITADLKAGQVIYIPEAAASYK